jgi:integrase
MSLYRRTNSPYWWIRFQLDGREVRASTGTEDRGQAEELERHARDSVWRQVKLGEKPPYLWAEARKRWLDETRKRTRAKDEEILSWFDKHLKRQTVQDITRPVVEHLRALKAEESSESTADRYMALLRAVLRKCVNDWQVLASAPKISMYRPRSPEARWLTQPEFEKLCESLPDHLALAARFAVTTGLRMRSMTALTWDRVDMQNRRAWIPGAQMKAGIPHGIFLSRKAIRLLRKLKKLNPAGDRVFQWNGKPIDDCNTRAFQDAVKAAGLQPLRWHDLRHTFASWAVQNGVQLPDLMQLGGWKSYSMVQKYAHLAPEHLAAAAEKASGGSHKNRHTRMRKPKREKSSCVSS